MGDTKAGDKLGDIVGDKLETIGVTVGDKWETTGRQGSKVPRTRRLEIQTHHLSHGLGKLGAHKF